MDDQLSRPAGPHRYPTEMNLVPKLNVALFAFVLYGGCDSRQPPVNSTPSASNTVLRGAPDFAPSPSTIPSVDDAEHVGPTFSLQIDSDGQIFRNDQLTSKSDVVDELLAIPNVGDFAIVIEGDADVRVSLVVELQSLLSESVPGLGTVTYIAVRDQDGG